MILYIRQGKITTKRSYQDKITSYESWRDKFIKGSAATHPRSR
jgi:hypothetical protein